MGLQLSSKQVKQVRGLQETLLSPLEHESVASWARATLSQLERAFCGSNSGLTILLNDEYHYQAFIDPKARETFLEYVDPTQKGAFRYLDTLADEAFDRRRIEGVEVFSPKRLAQITKLPLQTTPLFQDCVLPNGLFDAPNGVRGVPWRGSPSWPFGVDWEERVRS